MPGIYLMDEMHHATGYFVIGEEKVLVIDTMNGFTDIMSVIRGITDKPVVVVNTHGHSDHIFGNVYFDEAHINPKDLKLAEEMCALPECVKALERLMFLEDRADFILHGHAPDKDDISLMRCMRNGIEEICDGKTSDDKPYKWFGGEDMQHEFALVEGKQYSTEDSVICYRK